MKNGEQRRNPVRNQIDYVLINNKYLQFVTNARSYNTLESDSDHNLVMMNLKIKLPKLSKPKIDVKLRIKKELLKKKTYADTYKQKVNEMQNAKVSNEFKDDEAIWNDIISDCLEAG